MKVVATSDLHGRLPEVPDCDLLLLAGDICPDHPIGKVQRYGLPDNGASYQAAWLDGPFRKWLEGLRVRHIVIAAIWGNHDFVGEHPSLVPRLPWNLIQDERFVFYDLTIWGTPWVPGLPRWAFYGSSEALRARAEAIPAGIDILMTHGPPYGTADFVAPQFGSTHVGDRALRAELPRIAPGLIVCGHIHERFGVCSTRKGTPVFNVSHMNENYDDHRARPLVTLPL